MARKFVRRPRRKRRAKRGTKRRGKSKVTFGKVARLIDKKLDLSIPDKHKIDTDFISIVDHYDSVSRVLMKEITPAFDYGDDVSERSGDVINMKRCSLQFRMRWPYSQVEIPDFQDSGSGSTTVNLFNDYPATRVYLLRVNQALGNSISDSSLGGYLKARFLEPGKWRQETQTDSGQNIVSGVNLIASTKIQPKFKNVIAATSPFTDSLGNDEPSSLVVTRCPQFTHFYLNHKISKKWTLDRSTNKPVRYKYYLYMQFGDNWRTSYDEYEGPHTIDYRSMWIYENPA